MDFYLLLTETALFILFYSLTQRGEQVGLVYVQISVAPIVGRRAEVTVEGHPHIFHSVSAGDGNYRSPSSEASVVEVAEDISYRLKASLLALLYTVSVITGAGIEARAAEEVSLFAYPDGRAARFLCSVRSRYKGISVEGAVRDEAEIFVSRASVTLS